MPLYKFGRALIRLEDVVSMQELAGEGGRPAPFRVYYRGCATVDYEDEDALALRAFRDRSQPPPSELPPPDRDEKAARVLEPLDPSTGRPLGREAIGGA
jgi:hypothetical protein